MLRYFGLFIFALFLMPYSLYAQFTISSAITNNICSGDAAGSISLTVSGGNSPYTYQWNPNGQTTQSITNVSGGDYSVTITDNSGNDTTIALVISEPSAIADNSQIDLPYCTNNGTIVISPSGGTAPYDFLWNNGNTIQGITEAGAGDYSVIITDAINCTATFAYQLTEDECFVTPQAYFTPNDDGINDTWAISNSQYFPDAKLIVFDRWGVKVYQNRGMYEEWDGKSYLGIPVPDAAYYYFFYKDKNDEQKGAKKGSVIIIR